MAKRTLSQNFLVDPNIIEKIIHSAAIESSEYVLEIGPGRGAITKGMAERAHHLIAIEKDRDLIDDLKKIENATIYEGDILDFDLSLLPKTPLKVVSNLPYHITSKILKRLAMNKSCFSSLYVMVQKEFADKLIEPHQTALIAFLQTYYEIKKLFHISRGCFFPKPGVVSAYVHLSPIDLPFDPEYYTFLSYGYQHKRKMLLSQLKEYYDEDQLIKAFENQDIDSHRRIQTLTPLQLHALFFALKESK